MNTPIIKLRATLLVVLFAMSSSFASHAVASVNPNLVEQIALAVIEGIQASDMADEQKKAVIAEVGVAAALTNPSEANTIGAAIADKYPALASWVATAIIHALNATSNSSYVSRQTMASLATNHTAYINLHIIDAPKDQRGGYSESTVNSLAMTRAIIMSASPN